MDYESLSPFQTYNETVFLGVEISEELIVSIRAWTLAGGSVPISKRFQILRNPSDAEGTESDLFQSADQPASF